MAIVELAVDAGSSNTSIFQRGTGLVLREPSVLAVSGGRREKLAAWGADAKKLIGKAAGGTTVSMPISRGVAEDVSGTARLLGALAEKVVPERVFFKKKFSMLLPVPCGSTPSERQMLSDAAYKSGASRAAVVDAPVCALLGLGVPVSASEPVMIVDIGGGKTDIAVVTTRGMLTGCTVGIGGADIDLALQQYLEGEFGLRAGAPAVERLKTQVGSLHPNDRAETEISGIDAATGAPLSMVTNSRLLYDVIELHYRRIFELTNAVLKDLPAEIRADIQARGIYVIGGASKVAGLHKAMAQALSTKVNQVDEPAFVTALGAGILLSERKALDLLLSA